MVHLQSTITCPQCGHQATETMPLNACVALYDCKGCGATLKPLPGSCCVFCSYGSVPCPPIQQGVELLYSADRAEFLGLGWKQPHQSPGVVIYAPGAVNCTQDLRL
jgi:transposase-like protein